MKNFFTTATAILAMVAFTLAGCADSSNTEQFSEVSEHDNEQPHEDPHAGHAHPTHGPHGGDLIELGNEEYHAELVHPHGHDDDAHHDDAHHDDAAGHHDGDDEAHHKDGPDEGAHDKDGEAHHKDSDHADGDHEHGHDEDGDHDHAAHEHAGITIYILDGAAKNAVAIEAPEITLNLTHDGKPEQFKLAAMPHADDAEGKSSRFASAEKALLEHFHEADHVEGTLVLSIGGKSFRGKLTHSHDDAHGHAHGDH